MNALIKLVDVCEAFKRGEFDTEEFQKRIETIYLPDEYKNTLEKIQHNSCNKLEEIQFCYTVSQKQYADLVADELISAVLSEQTKSGTPKLQ